MTEQELREKIIETLEKGGRNFLKSKETKVSIYEYYADALIAAEIGDLVSLMDKWREMLRVQAEKTEQEERRAEVAKRALKLACKTIAPSHSDTAKLYFVIVVGEAENELTEEKQEP